MKHSRKKMEIQKKKKKIRQRNMILLFFSLLAIVRLTLKMRKLFGI